MARPIKSISTYFLQANNKVGYLASHFQGLKKQVFSFGNLRQQPAKQPNNCKIWHEEKAYICNATAVTFHIFSVSWGSISD